MQRVKTKAGQVVYASRAELDQWLARVDVSEHPEEPTDSAAPHDEDVVDPAAPAPPLPPPVPEPAPARRVAAPSWLLGVTAVAVVMLALAYSGFARVTPNYAAAELTLAGRSLEARDSRGRLLWQHDFGRDVSNLPRELQFGTNSSEVYLTDVDLDNDGMIERVVPLRYAIGGQHPADSDGLFAFRAATGAVMWSVSPPDAVTCGGETFEGPWRLVGMTVSAANGPKKVWASYVHHTHWPSIVVEMAPDGRQSVRYVQSGWVMSLAEWVRPDGTYLAAAGVLNEVWEPSIALIRTDGPPSVSPTVLPKFSCDVQGVPPVEITTVAPFEVPRAQGFAYLMTNRLHRLGGRLRAEFGTHAVALLDASGAVVELSHTDMYWQTHQVLSHSGVLPHTVDLCPEHSQPKAIRRWTPAGGWTEYTVVPRGVATIPGRPPA